MRKLPPKSTGSFDKLETANIVPRRDSNNTADDRIVIGGKAGDIVTFKAGTIVEGLEQATTGNAPDLSAYPTKEEMELALADKEDASVGDTHALKTDVESLDAEDIKAVPLGMQSDYYPSASGDSDKDIEMSSDIQNVGDAIAYNLELTRLLALRNSEAVNNATSTNFVSLDEGTWPQSLKTSFAESTPELNSYNQTQMNSFIYLELDKEITNRQKSDASLQDQIDELKDLPPGRSPIFAEDEPTEYPYAEDGESTDLEADDRWYQVTDPSFNYDDPDPEGLELYIWTPTEDDPDVYEWVLFVAQVTGGAVIISDKAPENAVNGTLWFDNSSDIMQLFSWHGDPEAWIPVSPPTTLEGRVSTTEDTQQAIIAQIEQGLEDQKQIEAKVEELSITKGAVARYVVKDTAMSGIASRNGELYVNSPDPAEVMSISFAPFDENGQATKPCEIDDIIEFVEAAPLGTYALGDVTRYKVLSGDPNALWVEYLAGNNDFVIGEAEEVYIYPQNSDTASLEYVDSQDELKLSKTGGTMTGSLTVNTGPIGASVTVMGTRDDGEADTLFWVYHNQGVLPDAVNYRGQVANPQNITNKEYVDAAIDEKIASTGDGVPVGSIMMWMNSAVPDGWFKLQGQSFNIDLHPKLHNYLQQTQGYVSGKLPDWSGRFAGEYGGSMANNLGSKLTHRTAMPDGGAPTSTASIPTGAIRSFNGAGQTNAYSDGTGKVIINSGWDSVTRPDTVVVHHIIKGD